MRREISVSGRAGSSAETNLTSVVALSPVETKIVLRSCDLPTPTEKPSDRAPTSGELADTSSCCGQPRFPNLPAPTGKAALLGPEGGGQVGALLLSPFVKGGAVSQEPYDHFSLLRTIEDFFGVPHLGYAALPKVTPLEASMFKAH